MLETARQNSIVSYAGLAKANLLHLAKQAFVQADFNVPERFASFLPLFPFELIQNMNYVGKDATNKGLVSPLGFSMDPQEYHAKLYRQMPALYQDDNYRRNFDYEDRFLGRSVLTVDAAWVTHFPQFAPFMSEKLMLHLIGGGHQAVVVPESVFPRGGGVLSAVERSMQITQRAEQFAKYVKERMANGDVYDPELFGHDYLELTGLAPVMLLQNELGRILQDLSIARSLINDNAPAGLFTESAKRVEHLHQYVPFLYACDTFETLSVTKHTSRLFQPYHTNNDFISDLWLPYQDVADYIDRDTMTIDMRRLCEGYQIAPIYDPATGGGRYPNALRVIVVRDRDIPLMGGDVLSNPAYGSGMNLHGMIGKQVFIHDSRELLRQRKLALEDIDLAVKNTTLAPQEYARAMLLCALQEYKGNLVDAMYRREAALSQMAEGTASYEKAKTALDEKVASAQKQVDQASDRWKHGQVSGYDADIDYLRRKQWNREGPPEEDQRESLVFSLDLQREQSIESGYAMRDNGRRLAYQDVYIGSTAVAMNAEAPSTPPEPAQEKGVSPEEFSPKPQDTSPDQPMQPDPQDPDKSDEPSDALPVVPSPPSDEALSEDALPAPKARLATPRTPASFQDLSHKLNLSNDPNAPKLAYIVHRDSESKIRLDNKGGKMASLNPKKPKGPKP